MSPANVVEEIFERSQIEDFFKRCIDTMKSEGTRETLKEKSSGRPGSELVRIQKNVWDDLSISPEAGQLAITRIEENFPGDDDLISLKQEFAKSIDVAYLQCLEDRRPQVLETKKEMPRKTVLEFLDACSVKFDTAEVQERLTEHIKETGTMPDPVIQQILDEVMELLGYERNHGQASFQKFGASKDFAKDREAAIAYQRWRSKTAEVCISLLHKYKSEGGTLNVDEDVKSKLRELQAKEELDAMSAEERTVLLQKNAQKLSVVRGLPPDGRQRYLEKLGEEEKLELAKTEILVSTLEQMQAQAHQ